MNHEEFLISNNKNNQLKNIKYILGYLEHFPFVNIEFTDEPITNSETVISMPFNSHHDIEKMTVTLRETLIVNISKEIVSGMFKTSKIINFTDLIKDINIEKFPSNEPVDELTGINSSAYLYVKKRNKKVIDKLLEDNKSEENYIISNGLITSSILVENYMTQPILQSRISGSIYLCGQINSYKLYVDPYMFYSDKKILIIKNKPVTVKINSLMELETDNKNNLIFKNNFEILFNTDAVTLVNWDIKIDF
jgi:hypothetical protein